MHSIDTLSTFKHHLKFCLFLSAFTSRYPVPAPQIRSHDFWRYIRLYVYVAGVDAGDDTAMLPAEDITGAGSAQRPIDRVFDVIAAALPDAGSAEELRERSELGFLLENNNNRYC